MSILYIARQSYLANPTDVILKNAEYLSQILQGDLITIFLMYSNCIRLRRSHLVKPDQGEETISGILMELLINLVMKYLYA